MFLCPLTEESIILMTNELEQAQNKKPSQNDDKPDYTGLDLYPGVCREEEKQRAVTQRALYRRLFMDIEREQVKETQRCQAHRKRITKYVTPIVNVFISRSRSS